MIKSIKLSDGTIMEASDNPNMFAAIEKVIETYSPTHAKGNDISDITGVMSHKSQSYNSTGIGTYTVRDMFMPHSGCALAVIDFIHSPKVDMWLINTLKQKFGVKYLDIIKYDSRIRPYAITFIMANTVVHGTFAYSANDDLVVPGAANRRVIQCASSKVNKEVTGYAYPMTHYIVSEK